MTETTIMMMYIYNAIIRVFIPLIVGIYVFWDAGRRGMKRFLWTAIAALVPSLIGFVIYLMARHGDRLRCHKCKSRVHSKDVTCPKCGVRLRPVCEKCGANVEEDYKVCPYCASPLPNFSETVAPPEREKDTGLGKLIAAMVIIPLTLILIVWGITAIGDAMDGGHNVAFMSTETYFNEKQDPNIEAWVESCNDENKAYILRYRDKTEDGNKRTWYLIYVPAWQNAEDERIWDVEQKDWIFGPQMDILLTSDEGEKGISICTIRETGADFSRLRIYLDGKLLEKEITNVDYPLGIFDIEEKKTN